jgi:hypothetical protein
VRLSRVVRFKNCGCPFFIPLLKIGYDWTIVLICAGLRCSSNIAGIADLWSVSIAIIACDFTQRFQVQNNKAGGFFSKSSAKYI